MAGNTGYKNKWQSENCERISLVVKKGRKQIIQDYAKAQGKSLNAYINDAVDAQMAHDEEEDKERSDDK